ncbi:MAG: carbamoyltransferase HypF, partial [Gammaproteobacteria bacterium]|nr:carbamoyltransferase HypF [Gammaproteobacteria bacterium]
MQEFARKVTLSGVVQGVGFRPFIYRHAQQNQLNGWVRNSSGRVEVHIQGELHNLEEFENTLIESAPGLSRPILESSDKTSCLETDEFQILPSLAAADVDIHLPADLFTCDDCLQELTDPKNRRYRYPFINCTQCGPRYTLIESLPYDRPNTSMSGFPLCSACDIEYADPLDRRYHAEPVACEECGPVLTFTETGQDLLTGNEEALEAALRTLAGGKVLAVKGIGGYHLVCDARSDKAVNQLRKNKPRPHKPLAVMFPVSPGNSLKLVRNYLDPNDVEARLLESAARPIVLIRQKSDSGLSAAIAPGLTEVGAMLPYSPLHHLLLNDFGTPLVATSANVSGEPVLTSNDQIEQRLSHVADAFLHHDRPIVRPADDPVFRIISGHPAPIRQGRGLAPVEIELPFKLAKPLLAVGSHMKNTVALAWDDRVVVSPHIGEMDSLRSLQTFEQCITDLQALYQVNAEHIVCDAHPGYTPSRWAHQQELPVVQVYHHHAHAAGAYYEALQNHKNPGDLLVFTWDGVGLGPDGTLWGGETLLGQPGKWQRVASFRLFKLPGGERAGREPWRSAAALCWETGQECPLEEASDPLLYSFWQQGTNAPLTSAAGRLFDAASSLTGVCTTASFEGQGPMMLETLASTQLTEKHHHPEKHRHPDKHRHPNKHRHGPGQPLERSALSPSPGEGRDLHRFHGMPIELPLSKTKKTYITDWAPLIPMLLNTSVSKAKRAANFHISMAHTLLAQATRLREDTGINS